MQTLDAARLVCRPSYGRTGLSTEAIANRANIKLGSLNSALDDHRPFRIEWIAPLTHATGDTLLIEQIAEDCGGRFVASAGEWSNADPLRALLTAIRECSDVETAVAEALEDGAVSDDELHRIEQEVAEAQHALGGCLRAVEAKRASQRTASNRPLTLHEAR